VCVLKEKKMKNLPRR